MERSTKVSPTLFSSLDQRCLIVDPEGYVHFEGYGKVKHSEIKKKEYSWLKQKIKDMYYQKYVKMSIVQERRCCICGSTENLTADHSHKEGHFRSLLCNSCNLALGLLRESPRRALLLHEYAKLFGDNKEDLCYQLVEEIERLKRTYSISQQLERANQVQSVPPIATL